LRFLPPIGVGQIHLTLAYLNDSTKKQGDFCMRIIRVWLFAEMSPSKVTLIDEGDQKFGVFFIIHPGVTKSFQQGFIFAHSPAGE
jgi:hypothetical protein